MSARKRSKQSPPLVEHSAIMIALRQNNIISRIFYYLHTADYDYLEPSHLINMYSNTETTALHELLEVQRVARYWRSTMQDSFVPINWICPRLVADGDNHRLNIPFLSWLGRNIRDMANASLVPQTNFLELEEKLKQTGLPQFFISQPAVNRILLRFTASRHVPLAPSRLGSLYDSYAYSLPVTKRQVEDIFILKQPTGVKTGDIINAITGYTASMFKLNNDYSLWGITIGFVADDSKTLYPRTKRYVNIFPTDHRLEICNKYLDPTGNYIGLEQEEYWARTVVYPP